MDKEIFNDTLQSLQDALAYIKGDKTKGRSKTVTIPDVVPVKEFSKEDIKRIRTARKMTQRIFAEIIGVSQKTVESWEAGTNKPTGSAKRVMQLIEADDDILSHWLTR
ncbi:MAG: helix-turn-helix domain-containing protein [Clostridiales bacterium]|jgi:putative transcriptional regulator|nr:helix-turn-helix domain-containing protein [Clostridiales bacterium]